MSECISTRVVLWILVLTGFAINYMVRVNINIAIVAMVKERSSEDSDTAGEIVVTSECFNATNKISDSNNYTKQMTLLEDSVDEGIKFDWNEQQQNLILGSFYWSMWITQLPGGVLAQKYGTKSVYGLSQLISVLLNFAVPICGRWGFYGIFINRFLQGLANGFTWPAMHTMIGKWVPPNERSKFLSAYLGSSLGAAFVFPGCAVLISWWGWEAVFHATGVIGTLWFIAWCFLVYDSPREHPRISQQEREYIEEALGSAVQQNTTIKLSTPWYAIFTSFQVWLISLLQFSALWGFFTLLTQAPTYFRFIHGYAIGMTGLLSGVPNLSRVIFSLIFSTCADFLLQKNKVQFTAVRKIATFVGVVLSGVFMLGLAFAGCDSTLAIVFLTISVALGGSVSSGALSAIVDLTPNFAGVVFGIVSTISVVPGFISPVLVGYLTYQNQSSSQWQIVFLIGAVLQIISGTLFVLFSTSDLQSWNSPASVTSAEDRNLVTGQKKTQLQNKL